MVALVIHEGRLGPLWRHGGGCVVLLSNIQRPPKIVDCVLQGCILSSTSACSDASLLKMQKSVRTKNEERKEKQSLYSCNMMLQQKQMKDSSNHYHLHLLLLRHSSLLLSTHHLVALKLLSHLAALQERNVHQQTVTNHPKRQAQ